MSPGQVRKAAPCWLLRWAHKHVWALPQHVPLVQRQLVPWTTHCVSECKPSIQGWASLHQLHPANAQWEAGNMMPDMLSVCFGLKSHSRGGGNNGRDLNCALNWRNSSACASSNVVHVRSGSTVTLTTALDPSVEAWEFQDKTLSVSAEPTSESASSSAGSCGHGSGWLWGGCSKGKASGKASGWFGMVSGSWRPPAGPSAGLGVAVFGGSTAGLSAWFGVAASGMGSVDPADRLVDRPKTSCGIKASKW